MAENKEKEWTVYCAYGFHSIIDLTNEEFLRLKKFHRLIEIKQDFWTNSKNDIFVWRKEDENGRS